ncbi:MAG: acyl-CoA dehydrogenase [Alphaproteobacteria bacterium]
MAEAPYSKWIGMAQRLSDEIHLSPVRSMMALLDDTTSELTNGSALPPMWHWLYFLPRAPQSEIGPDGHPKRGDFMPPIELPRRMFAGSRVTFVNPLVIGRAAERIGTIRGVSEKEGATGRLVFVSVNYQIRQGGHVCIEEDQDIVYRAASERTPAPAVTALPPPPSDAWVRTIRPDPVLLFRYSALTFNAHRIHFDRTYAVESEGYPGLVVHGPLTATLLVELVRQNSERPIRRFAFRARAPLFDLAPFRIVGVPSGDVVDLEATGPDGVTAMTAKVELG